LKNPVNGTSVLTGILKSFEDMGTRYDIVIYPKYITNTLSQRIIDVLKAPLPDGNNIISYKPGKDKKYKMKVREFLKLKGLTEYGLSIEIIRGLERCLTINRYDLFGNIVEAIDFSLYVAFIIRKLQPTLRAQYDGPIFIQVDNIMNVEVIKYETLHAVRLQDINNRIFPKVYRKTEFPLIRDVTAD
jgi:hypothetical protein